MAFPRLNLNVEKKIKLAVSNNLSLKFVFIIKSNQPVSNQNWFHMLKLLKKVKY